MNVTATYKGASVTIVDITVNGQAIYTSYVDGSGNFKVDIDWLKPQENPVTIATGATVV